jgi:hypothetical protein
VKARFVVPPDAVEFIVIASVVAFVVIVIFVPATSVSVSLVVSATTFDCPVTAIVENIFWSPVFVPLEVPENVPDCVASVQSPSVVRAVLASASSKRVSPNAEACESSSLLSRAV